MTQVVVCTGSFFVSICLLLHPRPISIRTWLQHALKKTSKPGVGKLVNLLDDVFSNSWKQDAVFTSLSLGIEVTTEVYPIQAGGGRLRFLRFLPSTFVKFYSGDDDMYLGAMSSSCCHGNQKLRGHFSNSCL